MKLAEAFAKRKTYGGGRGLPAADLSERGYADHEENLMLALEQHIVYSYLDIWKATRDGLDPAEWDDVFETQEQYESFPAYLKYMVTTSIDDFLNMSGYEDAIQKRLEKRFK